MASMIHAVFFDLGDTLIRMRRLPSAEAVAAAGRPVYERLLQLGQKPPDLATYLRRMRWTCFAAYVASRFSRREVLIAETIRRVHRTMGISLDAPATDQLVAQSFPAVRMFFDVEQEALTTAQTLHRAGVKLGLISNTWIPGHAIDKFLRDEGLFDYFPVRVYSSEVGYMKPDRKIFRLALDQLGTPAARAAYVGDRVYNDVLGSSRAGLTSILFDPHDRRPLLRGRADVIVQRLSQVPLYVQSRM